MLVIFILFLFIFTFSRLDWKYLLLAFIFDYILLLEQELCYKNKIIKSNLDNNLYCLFFIYLIIMLVNYN